MPLPNLANAMQQRFRAAYLVELQDPKLDLLVLVLVLLGLSVSLLLPLLASTAQAQHQMQGGLLLDVVVRKSAAILELLSGKDQALLIRRDSLLVLDLGLDIVNSVRRLYLKGNSLPSNCTRSQCALGQS